MRPEILNIYRTVHTWTGILTGLLLFIAFFAGALTLFAEPVTDWATPEPEVHRWTPVERAPELIDAVLTAHPEAARMFWLQLDDERRRARLTWEVRPEGAGEHDALAVQHFSAALDGQDLHTDEVRRSKAAAVIDVLHRVVGLPVDDDLSRSFMGVVAALYFVSLVSGLIYVLPRFTRDVFRLHIDGRIRRMWRDAHAVVGIGSLPFHLMIALTASVFAFHDPIYAAQDVVVHRGGLGAAFRGPPPSGPDPEIVVPPDLLVQRAAALSPDLDIYGLQYVGHGTPRAGVRVWGRDEQGFGFRTLGSFVQLDPGSGEVRSVDYLPSHQDPGGRLLSALFASHFATFGGGAVKAIYFGLALAGAWLFYSGNLIWLETRRSRAGKGRSGEQTRPVRVLGALTVGVPLGSMLGIGALLLATKGLPLLGLAADDWLFTVYYLVFFASVGWAFLRGTARASVELLWLAVAVAWALPASSVVGRLLPGSGLWGHTETLSVDVVALGLGACLALFARYTGRRVAEGPTDSVWSAVRPGDRGELVG